MNRQLTIAIIGSLLVVTSTAAHSEQVSIQGSYSNNSHEVDPSPNEKIMNLSATYFTKDMSDLNGPILEKDFMHRISNIGVSTIINKTEFSASDNISFPDGAPAEFGYVSGYEYASQSIGIDGDFYINDFILTAAYNKFNQSGDLSLQLQDNTSSISSFSDNLDIINLGIGYFIADSTLINLELSNITQVNGNYRFDTPTDAELSLKNVANINGNFLSSEVSANYNTNSGFGSFKVGSNYYLTKETSFGINYETDRSKDNTFNKIGINGNHFLNNNFMIGGELTYAPETEGAIESQTTATLSAQYRF